MRPMSAEVPVVGVGISLHGGSSGGDADDELGLAGVQSLEDPFVVAGFDGHGGSLALMGAEVHAARASPLGLSR